MGLKFCTRPLKRKWQASRKKWRQANYMLLFSKHNTRKLVYKRDQRVLFKQTERYCGGIEELNVFFQEHGTLI